jgi:hypothetical protein
MKLPALRFRLWTLFLAIALLAGGLAVVRRLERKVALNNDLRRSFTVLLEDQVVRPEESVHFLEAMSRRSRAPTLRRDLSLAVVELQEDQVIDVGHAQRDLARASALQSLRGIDLASIPIDKPVRQALWKLPELRWLHVGVGSSDEQIRACLPGLTHLTRIDLSNSQISDETGAAFADLQGLEDIGLERTAIGHRTCLALGQLPRLRGLSLNGCKKLTSDSIALLAASQSLERIMLWDTACNDEALIALAAIPSLRQVSLYEATRTTPLGAQRFKLLRPDVQVVRPPQPQDELPVPLLTR